MFFIAMHFLYKKQANQNIVLPDKLPVELEISAGDEENNQMGQAVSGPGGLSLDSLSLDTNNLQVPPPHPSMAAATQNRVPSPVNM